MRSALPGLGLSLSITVGSLAIFVVLPLGALLLRALEGGPGVFAAALTPRALSALWLSLWASALAASINAVFGLGLAWALARWRFFGRRAMDALVDLPFALPTAVAGLSLTSLYAPQGWLGQLAGLVGVKVAFTPLGIVVALVFVGLPFVVRTVQPVLQSLEPELEEAAASLGATRWVVFWRVLFPALRPAWLTGVTLAFARALGEYGSVVFIAGNLPGKTQIAPLLIVTRLEEFDVAGACALASVMLGASLVLLLALGRLQRQTHDEEAAHGG